MGERARDDKSPSGVMENADLVTAVTVDTVKMDDSGG